MTRTVTVRLPRAWMGRFDSVALRQWVRDYLRSPTPNLPHDPGGGEWRASFSVPKRQLKVVSGLLDESELGALRRIIASRVGMLAAAKPSFVLPAMASPAFVPSIPPSPLPVSSRKPVLALGTWIPGRSLDH